MKKFICSAFFVEREENNMKTKERERKTPSVLAAGLSLLAVITTIVVSIKLNFGSPMAVFLGAAVSIFIALLLGNKWEDIQKEIVESVSKIVVAIIILLLVGILIGVWMIGGTLPSLIYFGLKTVSPSALIPLTFVLCLVTSVCTGTSFGSIATMGLAMFSIGINMGIPAPVIAGTIVSGAYFGDKMSPLSDTTNVAAAMSGTDLFSHIGSMLYTTVPATVVVFIIYLFLGMKYGSGTADTANVVLMMDTLESNFNISFAAILPLLLVLVLSALRVPSVITMGASGIVSILFAVTTQHAAFSDVMTVALKGFSCDTGLPMIDAILNRGGMTSMTSTIILMIFACMMSGALQRSQVLDVLVDNFLMKFIRSRSSLIVSTLAYCYVILMLTGSPTLGIIIPGKTLQKSYDELNINRKVLSRSLEDASTIGSPIIPWTSSTLYITGVLGISCSYIPYAFLCYIVPIFSVICAVTGFGIWNGKGEKIWGREKRKVAIQ